MKDGATVNGEIISYESQSNVLILQENNYAKPRILFVNLAHVEKVDVSPQASNSVAQPDSPIAGNNSIEEARRRLRREERKYSSAWLGNASPEAVKAFLLLKKQYSTTVWDGTNIRVMRDIIVRDPFDENSVEGTNQRTASLQAVEQVKKVLSQVRTIPP